jgi:putative membrane-bound dehydrogenase-like protein
MGDYPLGEKQGRIKTLEDTDGDGRYDQATIFLDGLAFPTGVLPWRDGVLITAAPDVLFARDLDGDGRADEVQTRYTGFRLANPQHRINGFAYGLDHALQLASGDNLGEITSATTGATINASGKDVKIWPDSGELAAISGRTQYVRARNDWGEWFGNNNSRPMYQFPLAERYLARNPHVAYVSNQAQLFGPARVSNNLCRRTLQRPPRGKSVYLRLQQHRRPQPRL